MLRRPPTRSPLDDLDLDFDLDADLDPVTGEVIDTAWLAAAAAPGGVNLLHALGALDDWLLERLLASWEQIVAPRRAAAMLGAQSAYEAVMHTLRMLSSPDEAVDVAYALGEFTLPPGTPLRSAQGGRLVAAARAAYAIRHTEVAAMAMQLAADINAFRRAANGSRHSEKREDIAVAEALIGQAHQILLLLLLG